MKGTQKRVQPPRHKPTLSKYVDGSAKVARQLRRSNHAAQSKHTDLAENDRHGKPRKKSEEDSVDCGDNVRLRALDEFFDADAQSHLINISRTSKGLTITRPGEAETRSAIQLLTNQTIHAFRTKIEVLDNVNSLLVGPDDKLYNLLTSDGFKDLMKAEELMQERAKQKPISCNCKKTHCLKMYCECISKNLYCNSDCQCRDCFNNSVHENQRQKSKEKTARKGPLKSNFLDNDNYPVQKNCNCKKSGCNKKYCECFGTGVKCSMLCRCEGCKNREENEVPLSQQDIEERPINFTYNYEDNNVYGNVNASNGFNLSQIGYDSIKGRSMFGHVEQDVAQPKLFSFAGVNQQAASKNEETKR